MHLRLPASWTFCILLAGCAFGVEQSTISDQLKPSGPCWSVDLSDGLNDSSTEELHDLFSCLNRTGNLDSFIALDQAMDDANRRGETIGLSLISLSNRISESEVNMLGLAGKALELLQIDRGASTTLLRFLVELTYGTPFEDIDDSTERHTEEALNDGLLKPALMLSSTMASKIVDGGTDTRLAVNALIDNATLRGASCTIEALEQSDDPQHSAIIENPMEDLAEAWLLASDTSNNVWTGANGNSIRDLISETQSFMDGEGYIRFRTELHQLLSDDRVRANTNIALTHATEQRHIDHLAAQLTYLTTVDAAGRDLDDPIASESSALQVGVRLIHAANQPLECDLWLLDPIRIDNMATRLLREIGQLETAELENGLNFLVDLLDRELTPALLEAAVATGVCSGLTPELLQDLDVLERLNDAEVGNLVEVMHSLLDAVYQEGVVDRLPELVNMVSEVHISGLMKPIEEVLRDLHASKMASHAAALAPILLNIDDLQTGTCEDGSTPIGFDPLWTELLRIASGENLPEEAAIELVETLADQEQFWKIIDGLVRLIQNPTSQIHNVPNAISTIENQSIGIDGAALTSRLLEEQDTWDTVFLTLEAPSIRDAMVKSPEEGASPLPFVASLILSDTVTVMLQTIDLVLDSLTEE